MEKSCSPASSTWKMPSMRCSVGWPRLTTKTSAQSGCLVTVGQRIVKSGLLDAFHARHPGMIVELLMEQRMLDLSKGEADIAIRGGKLGPGALVGRKIAELSW